MRGLKNTWQISASWQQEVTMVTLLEMVMMISADYSDEDGSGKDRDDIQIMSV